MTSRQIEDIHKELLNQLLISSGLECVRTPPESTESFSSSEESDELTVVPETVVEESETIPEEQVPPTPEPIPQEELPEIFPPPSLRLPLSDKIRKIQEQNALHVLPKEFKTDIDPLLIPKIASTAPQVYIDILGGIVGCNMYKSSLAEFWFLDTLANLLRRAQEDNLNRVTQAILILWFCEWMKEMQNFDAADRKRMMRRFEENMLAAGRALTRNDRLPTPSEAGVHYNTLEEIAIGTRSKITEVAQMSAPYRHLVQFEEVAYECNMQDLAKIIHYIFDLFSTDYQYELVRSVFTFTPEYNLIDMPYQIQQPKTMYAPLKFKPKKPEKSPKAKDPKKQKGKKEAPDTVEYLALLEFQAKEARILDELEEIEREEWNRKSHILPLTMSIDDQFLDKYWPPPPPEPEPEPEPELKGKKGKGKK